MSQPPEPATNSKSHIPLWLVLVAVAAFLIFSLSFGGLVWWLVSRQPSTMARNVVPPVPPAPPPPETIPEPTAPVATAPAPAAPGFVSLFDSVSVSGWEGDPAVWSVQNGTLRAQTGKRPPKDASCLFWSGGELNDFELRFRFRLLNGNAGIYFRSVQLHEFNAGGYQFEIFSTVTGNLLDVGSDRTRRELFRVDSPAMKAKRKPKALGTGWHDGVITASGSRLVCKLDGELLCDISDDAPEAPRTGRLALEAASMTTVEFKDIELNRNPVLDAK